MPLEPGFIRRQTKFNILPTNFSDLSDLPFDPTVFFTMTFLLLPTVDLIFLEAIGWLVEKYWQIT